MGDRATVVFDLDLERYGGLPSGKQDGSDSAVRRDVCPSHGLPTKAGYGFSPRAWLLQTRPVFSKKFGGRNVFEDVIVEMVQRASEAGIKRHGDMKGWIKHLQAMDRARTRKAKKRRAKSVAGTAKNGRPSEKPPRRERTVAEATRLLSFEFAAPAKLQWIPWNNGTRKVIRASRAE